MRQIPAMKSYITLLLSCILTIPFQQINAQPASSFTSRGIGGGGALFSPSINPGNHSEMFLGCDMSDLFHSSTQGQNWDIINFSQVQGGHDSYVSFTNSNILYTVSYPSPNGNDEILPVKSTDGGQTWNVLSGNPFPNYPTAGVLRLFADYNNANHLVIADYGTIWFSNDGGNNFRQFHTCVYNGAGNHIAGVYFDGNNIYVGTNDGVIFSTDGGTSFNTMTVTGIPLNEKILSFAGGKENGVTRFICLTSDSSNVYSGIQYGSSYYNTLAGVYTMDNSSGTWISKMGGITIGSDYPVFVGMANNDIDTLYIAGGSSVGSPIVMRAVGSGNWQEVFLTDTNKNIYTGWAGTHGDHQWSFPEAPFGFEVCKNDSRIVMFGDYSCSHITTDGGVNWQQQYLSTTDQNAEHGFTPVQKKYHGVGLENTSCWQVMWTDSSHLFSAFSDINGIMSDDKGSRWKFIPNLTSNSTYRIVQRGDGNIYACVSNRHDIYQTTSIYDNTLNNKTGAIYLSTTNGASFSQIKSFGGPVIWIALDPTATDRMYASVINSDTTKGGIWRTDNLSAGAAATWVKCNNPPRTQGHPFSINVLKDGSLLVSFSARRVSSSQPFTSSSGVFYSTNGGQTWADRSDAGLDYYTQDVVVDANDSSGSTWFACVFSGWGNVPAGTGGLYKTTNKGVSWSHISSAYRVNSCTINPANPKELYFSTETDGLWYSNNIDSSNPTFSPVTAYPFRHPMRIFFNPWKTSEMWVSSFGYAMAVADLSCSILTPVISQQSNTLISTTASSYQWLLNGNPITGATAQTYIATQTGNYSVEVGSGNGCNATSITISVSVTDVNKISDESAFIIFPNPANQQLYVRIQNKNQEHESLELFNAMGQNLMSVDMTDKTETSLNIEMLASGIYYLKAAGITRKFIKL